MNESAINEKKSLIYNWLKTLLFCCNKELITVPNGELGHLWFNVSQLSHQRFIRQTTVYALLFSIIMCWLLLINIIPKPALLVIITKSTQPSDKMDTNLFSQSNVKKVQNSDQIKRFEFSVKSQSMRQIVWKLTKLSIGLRFDFEVKNR